MENSTRLILAIVALFIAQISFSQEVTAKEFLIGTFKYCDDKGAVIIMKKKKAVETFMDAQGNKVVVKSKIKWISDNKYQVTFVSVKGNTPAKKGMVVIGYVKGINGNEADISFTFSSGQKTGSCLKKTE